MNPINAINQEFTRILIKEWSDEAAIRCHEQQADTSPVGIVASIAALIMRVCGRINRRKDSRATTPLAEAPGRSTNG